MSRALVCDNCGGSLPLNARGDHDGGEDSAWLLLSIASEEFDLCTRSCIVAFLERPDVIQSHEAYIEAITGVARSINAGRAGTDESS